MRTEYVGAGEAAVLIAAIESMESDERRRELAEARAAERERLRALAEADALVRGYSRGVELAFRAEMRSRGLHRQGRHRWRRRRMSTAQAPAETKTAKKFTRKQANALLKRAQAPDDPGAEQAAHELMTSNWRKYFLHAAGNPATYVMDELVGVFMQGFPGNKNPLVSRAMEDKSDELMKGLTPPDAGLLEMLLARRVVVCWFAVHAAEWQAQRRLNASTAREIEAHARRVDSASRRFLATVRALADFRRVDVPSVLVNVMGHQPPAVPDLVVSGEGPTDGH